MNNALPFGFGFFTNDNTPLDAKYYRNFNSSVLGAIHEPYNDVNDVNSSIISSIRYKGLTVAVKNGATSIDEYWYRDGILDVNLVLKGSGSVGFSESLSQIVAGEDLLAGELVYLNTIDYKWYKADNLIETKIKGLIRIVKDNILTDDTSDAYNLGKVNLYTGLNIGSKYYIGSNGSIVDTLPITEGIFSRFVGVASSATELEFLLDESYYEMTLNDPSIIKIDESIASVMAGEALLAGDIIYLNTDNKWYKSDNTIESKIKGLIRVAKDDSVADALVDAYIFGSVNSYTGLVVGSNYYISTNGSISDTIPNIDGIFSRFIGVASSSTVLEFSDSGNYYEMTTTGGGGNVIDINVVDFQALLGVYSPSTTYKILDADFNLYGGTEVYLTTNGEGLLNERGLGKFYNPKYDQNVSGFNVWTNLSSFVATPTGVTSWTPQYPPENITGQNGATGKLFTTISGTKFIALTGDWSAVTSITGDISGATASISSVVLKSYTDGDLVHWGGKTWERDGTVTNGLVGTATDIYNLSGGWTPILFDSVNYNVVYDEIKYDSLNDLIVYRNEQNNNIVSMSKDYAGYYGIGYNPIKAFMWGNTLINGINVGIGSQIITNSYNENINFRGLYQSYLNLNNGSYQKNIIFDNGSFQQNLTFNSVSYQENLTFDNLSSQENLTFDNLSSQSYLTFDNSSTQGNLTFENGSFQYNLIFSNISTQSNLIFDNNSFQNNLTFDNLSSQEYLTFDNSSFQNTITFENGSFQSNLTFDNGSAQENLTFSNNSTQNKITFENGSSQDYLTVTGKNQTSISFNNYYYDRTSSPMLANETNLEFKGDLPTITTLNSTTDKIYVKQDNQVKEITTTDLQALIGISSNYIGQTSITTVGTLTTGSIGAGFGQIYLTNSIRQLPTEISTNTTLLVTHRVIYVDCTSNNVTLTLPVTTGNFQYIEYEIKRVDTNNVNTCTITTSAGTVFINNVTDTSITLDIGFKTTIRNRNATQWQTF